MNVHCDCELSRAPQAFAHALLSSVQSCQLSRKLTSSGMKHIDNGGSQGTQRGGIHGKNELGVQVPAGFCSSLLVRPRGLHYLQATRMAQFWVKAKLQCEITPPVQTRVETCEHSSEICRIAGVWRRRSRLLVGPTHGASFACVERQAVVYRNTGNNIQRPAT